MYDLFEDDEDNVVVQALMKASTNFKGHNNTLVAILCSNLHSQYVYECF